MGWNPVSYSSFLWFNVNKLYRPRNFYKYDVPFNITVDRDIHSVVTKPHTHRGRVLTAQFYNPVPRRLQKSKIVSKLPQMFNVAQTFSAVKLVSLSVSLVRLPTWIDFRRLHRKQFVI